MTYIVEGGICRHSKFESSRVDGVAGEGSPRAARREVKVTFNRFLQPLQRIRRTQEENDDEFFFFL